MHASGLFPAEFVVARASSSGEPLRKELPEIRRVPAAGEGEAACPTKRGEEGQSPQNERRYLLAAPAWRNQAIVRGLPRPAEAAARLLQGIVAGAPAEPSSSRGEWAPRYVGEPAGSRSSNKRKLPEAFQEAPGRRLSRGTLTRDTGVVASVSATLLASERTSSPKRRSGSLSYGGGEPTATSPAAMPSSDAGGARIEKRR